MLLNDIKNIWETYLKIGQKAQFMTFIDIQMLIVTYVNEIHLKTL